ncbi:MAG: bifunctional 23S rRNA (guanine(2069)-N(7))-methyltransferase RlmK/23S rRNA (guanine(2445)-N(2))-methyltransferase RlmL, partial [Actinobacteria bacterium]|nr:bifunctional 23S rRNA (guanine(2069)-N(7))-methyltransferase RlmK/23S rRNA (guanine(2445)-N(2))-methyltransferase RlmL [Actinomycetota bacterium]
LLLRLQSFPPGPPDELYGAARQVPWEDHVRPDGSIAVEVTSAITQGPLEDLNTHYAEQRVKDAIVDRFRERTRHRPNVDLSRPDIRINVHLAPGEAALSLDLAGQALHKRGYRLEGGEAPLKENLAAAILMRCRWPAIARRGGTLMDPLCGSGTLLIEGALMAGDVAPGLFRDYYGFLGWLGFESAPWRDLLREATARRDEGLAHLPPVYGFDADRRAVGAARANARRAGLAGRIILEQRDLSALTPPATEPGLVMTNPPYGKRLGDLDNLVPLYEMLGERLRRSFSGWEAAVFTGNPQLSAHLGLRARRVNVFYNGPILCKLLVFDIGTRATEEAARRASPLRAASATPAAEPPLSAAAEMFANRLRKNARHLRRWAEREGITCYRVYDTDLPEYAVAVDIYGEWAHIQEYAPPTTVDPVKARRRVRDVVSVVPEVLQIAPERVVLKVRRPQRGREQYQRFRNEGHFIEATEGGLRFLVNLTDYLDTGLFLDHRPTRQLIRQMAEGRRFLNLFAYTGSATVYAAAGGALSTTTVDLSPTYLDWARRNLDLNGFSGPEHGLVRAECTEWLREAVRGNGTGPRSAAARERGRAAGGPRRAAVGSQTGPGLYDLIFMDPPTFSNSRSMQAVLDIQRDHSQLIRDCIALLAPEGTLLFSTNFRRFKLDLQLVADFNVVDITRQTVPPDFARNPHIHRCYRITR